VEAEEELTQRAKPEKKVQMDNRLRITISGVKMNVTWTGRRDKADR